MINVAALTSGKNLPSTRFRIRQHIQPLHDFSIEVKEFCPVINKYKAIPGKPDKLKNIYIFPIYAAWQGIKLATRIPGLIGSYRNQITWLSRELLPGYFTFELFLKKPVVFDADDAIWLTTPFGRSSVSKTARMSEVVVAGNNYLANWFSNFSKNICVIPTAVDTEIFQPNMHKHIDTDCFVIGWIGTQSTLPYLEAIEAPLLEFIGKYQNTQILVMSDKIPSFKQIPIEKVKYIPWSENSEVKAIQIMSVGLMPILDSEWARGKCAFKMLQYMSCGIPVIVSPVGLNAEVLGMGDVGFAARYDSEWYEALNYLYKNKNIATNMGNNGRVVVQKYFDRKIITKQIAEIFLGLV
jgi:glycosyltransferase involved in cell wall biosynthesis